MPSSHPSCFTQARQELQNASRKDENAAFCGSPVSKVLRFTHKGSIIVSASADDERKMVKVDVRDTGIGIAQENIDWIFQPFDQEDR